MVCKNNSIAVLEMNMSYALKILSLLGDILKLAFTVAMRPSSWAMHAPFELDAIRKSFNELKKAKSDA